MSTPTPSTARARFAFAALSLALAALGTSWFLKAGTASTDENLFTAAAVRRVPRRPLGRSRAVKCRLVRSSSRSTSIPCSSSRTWRQSVDGRPASDHVPIVHVADDAPASRGARARARWRPCVTLRWSIRARTALVIDVTAGGASDRAGHEGRRPDHPHRGPHLRQRPGRGPTDARGRRGPVVRLRRAPGRQAPHAARHARAVRRPDPPAVDVRRRRRDPGVRRVAAVGAAGDERGAADRPGLRRPRLRLRHAPPPAGRRRTARPGWPCWHRPRRC